MSSLLSPAKVLLLAVHYAAHADVESLTLLASRQATVLHQELLLRVLITHLPETVKPSIYVPLLQDLAHNYDRVNDDDAELDTTPVSDLSDDQATKRSKKLHLLHLPCSDVPNEAHNDLIAIFLFQRAYRMDGETGHLAQLPELLMPFLNHSPAIHSWVASTVLPYLRRKYEYYPQQIVPYSLLEFQNLPGNEAIAFLLSQTGRNGDGVKFLERDLRGLVGPWLQHRDRWSRRTIRDDRTKPSHTKSDVYCPGWEQVLEWLASQATGSWTIAGDAIAQWIEPRDENLSDGDKSLLKPTLEDSQKRYLLLSYSQAALASAYLVSDGTAEALFDVYEIGNKTKSLLGYQLGSWDLESALSQLPDLSSLDKKLYLGMKAPGSKGKEIFGDEDILTTSTEAAANFLSALTLSAFVCTQLGAPCSVRKAGELFSLEDQKEQKSELLRLIRAVSTQPHRDDDAYLLRARRQLLWLRNWGTTQIGSDQPSRVVGLISTLSSEFIETEFLRALLARSRCTLARAIYEDGYENPLPEKVIQDVTYHCAMNAFDNASNPNRSRGGLKKCDEIIHTFPKTLGTSHPARRQVEALLKCTHSLSDYRLVLKQGEPFNPIVLRVHSDPISIINKVLEQNPKSYTRLQEFLEIALNMVRAGITNRSGSCLSLSTQDGGEKDIIMAEKRTVAMCIEAALREDDFETAYSYVVSRLDSTDFVASQSTRGLHDEWSWNAALKAGQYVRTQRTIQPTHLGTASGNLEIRHLEQRLECLATALRVAPPSQLQDILKSFRRCEEQLDSAIRDEAENYGAWATSNNVPGTFQSSITSSPQSVQNAAATRRQVEETPMSLFDLSRATARAAQRNFTKLSKLPGITSPSALPVPASLQDPSNTVHDQQRIRKRDQLRDAATGTLVSGVGWLIGANVSREAGE